MKKKLTAILSVLLVLMLASSVFATSFSAASPTISYSFSGSNSNDKGFAEGTISLSGGSGSLSLYWADDVKAIDNFDPIATFNGSGSYKMPAYTAIPATATKVIAVSGSNRTVGSAAAVYNIPENKRLGKTSGDLLYRFANYSDFHIEADGVSPYNGYSAKYPYDEQHMKAALSTAAARGVDFIVTCGDHVNNQRNDNNNGNNNLYAYEWNRYLHILAESDYTGPIYEAIGNHELWNFETDSNKTPRDWKSGSRYFVAITGLDSTKATINSDKAYYEITEPVTGDHFLFMALEGGFYTDANNEFSDAQLNWLESKLNQYKNDGKNTFILEHANFYKWGSGDQINNPIYDIPLKFGNTATQRLKQILEAHKEAVIITGHTHFKYSLQLNYSDNSKSSATMMHVSSVGGIRDIQNGTTRVNDKSLDQTEGYIVEVYDNATIFMGTNLYYNKSNPSYTYIVPQTTSAINAPEPTDPPTEKPTDPPTQPPTDPPTEKPTNRPLPTNPPKPSDPATEPPTEKATDRPLPTNPPRPSDPATEPPTEKPTDKILPTNPPAPTEPKPAFIWGDVDGDNELSILDATEIQRFLAELTVLDEDAIARGKVNGDDDLTILDATSIQRKLAELIDKFNVETDLAETGAADIEIIEEAAQVELEEAGDDLNTLRAQASAALSKYWVLASYDQYQAMKKAYKENADYAALNAAYTAFNAAVRDFYPGDNITVKFKAPSGWGSVYAYAYNSGSDKLQDWPGRACTKSGDTWTISVPLGRYNYIIFNDNNGNHQTYDLALGVTRNQGYTGSGSGNKVNGLPYQY